jgi:hypothetical protein
LDAQFENLHFISLQHINVTWFSWFSALTEIGTGIVFAIVGIRARRSVEAVLR